jgi:hypothetical protein
VLALHQRVFAHYIVRDLAFYFGINSERARIRVQTRILSRHHIGCVPDALRRLYPYPGGATDNAALLPVDMERIPLVSSWLSAGSSILYAAGGESALKLMAVNRWRRGI